MQKQIESMNERELLEELVRQGLRREKTEKIKLCALALLLVAVVVLAAVYIPKILAPMRQISQSMQQVEETAHEAERVLSNFDEKTVDQLKQTMESLGETSQQVRVLMDTLRDSGLDKLQSTIEELTESLNSIGSIMKIFGR